MTLGPPCSSFVCINSSTHGRSSSFPYGDDEKTYVRMGTLLLVGIDLISFSEIFF